MPSGTCADAEIDALGITGAASHNPARVLGFGDRGNLLQRSRAAFLLLDRNLDLKAVFIGGRELA
jgi:N-acetylglucosamine-6-phosphate deacetylase